MAFGVVAATAAAETGDDGELGALRLGAAGEKRIAGTSTGSA
jgi:hypothetical protein